MRASAGLARLLVLAALAAFIGLAYLALPVGLGELLGTGPNAALSIAATAVVAIGFPHVRDWARRTANRLVHGERATPYEVVTELSERMAGAYPIDEVLAHAVEILALGTGAARARIWLKVGDELVCEATWPAETGPDLRIPVSATELPALPDADHAVAVSHRSELIGAITVAEMPTRHLSLSDLRLVDDFAGQASLVLRNVRLATELASSLAEISAQAAEIRASRRRIVDAQDAERRRVERDIHDGAQQYLVALMVQLRVVRTLATRDPVRAHAMVSDVEKIVEEGLAALGELAQGIHPPILTSSGLAVALQRQESNPAVRVSVEDSGIGRYSIDVEAAVYFSCLEALNNAAKYAAGAKVVVRLAETDGQLAFSVRDDGTGFDPALSPPGSGLGNMADRVVALGGALDIVSAPGRGTVVAGRVPLAGTPA